MHRNPEPLSKRLYDILALKHKLIPTPQEERLKLFSNSPVATEIQNSRNPWIRHTIQALEASLLIYPLLKQTTYEFHQVMDAVNIDVVSTKIRNCQGPHFQLHHRLLDFQYIHKWRKSCSFFQSGETQDSLDVCDCGRRCCWTCFCQSLT